MTVWKDIETLPQDSGEYVLTDGSSVFSGSYVDVVNQITAEMASGEQVSSLHPTHWAAAADILKLAPIN